MPPAWLMDSYVELAMPGRAFANLVPSYPVRHTAQPVIVVVARHPPAALGRRATRVSSRNRPTAATGLRTGSRCGCFKHGAFAALQQPVREVGAVPQLGDRQIQ